MISIERALELVAKNLPPRRTERIHFRSALGRVLAEDLAATSNVPPFHRSAMDGYALLAADVQSSPVDLEVVGEARAGGGDPGALKSGQAIAIMTGAPLPQNADAVQMIEETRPTEDGKKVTILKSVQPGAHIAPLGSEARQGDIVLESDRALGPSEIAVLATFGYNEVSVWKRPTIALLATGDELVEPEDQPRSDQIRNSNTYSLEARLRLLGFEPQYLGIARDNQEELERRICRGLQEDVFILTGGVSVGKYDLVRAVLHRLGLEIVFDKISMKPGKPTLFARRDNKLVFGLPGNPVSTLVAFENLVRPALRLLCGFKEPERREIQGGLLREVNQIPGRTAFLPAWATWERAGWKIDPIPSRGSADIIAFSQANSLLVFPGDRKVMVVGEVVTAVLLSDYFNKTRREP